MRHTLHVIKQYSSDITILLNKDFLDKKNQNKTKKHKKILEHFVPCDYDA